MALEPNSAEQDLLRRWVDTWRRAGPELEAVRRSEYEAVPIHEAIRQLFDGMDSILVAPGPASSGLVEQQMWFSKIRAKLPPGK